MSRNGVLFSADYYQIASLYQFVCATAYAALFELVRFAVPARYFLPCRTVWVQFKAFIYLRAFAI